MSTTQTEVTNPRPRTRKAIEDMLRERQQMLVLYWELAKQDFDYEPEAGRKVLNNFLAVLVDYIAAGHFSLYQRITEGTERRRPVTATAQELYPRIESTTDVAIEFSERYESPEETRLKNNLTNDLSVLGEEITTRMELEDQLILSMLGRDYEIPKPPPAARH